MFIILGSTLKLIQWRYFRLVRLLLMLQVYCMHFKIFAIILGGYDKTIKLTADKLHIGDKERSYLNDENIQRSFFEVPSNVDASKPATLNVSYFENSKDCVMKFTLSSGDDKNVSRYYFYSPSSIFQRLFLLAEQFNAS